MKHNIFDVCLDGIAKLPMIPGFPEMNPSLGSKLVSPATPAFFQPKPPSHIIPNSNSSSSSTSSASVPFSGSKSSDVSSVVSTISAQNREANRDGIIARVNKPVIRDDNNQATRDSESRDQVSSNNQNGDNKSICGVDDCDEDFADVCSDLGDDENGGDDSGGEDDGEKRKKKTRTVFSRSQVFQLESTFDVKRYLSSSERANLANSLHLTETQVCSNNPISRDDNNTLMW